LHREGGGGASIDGSEFKLVRHHEGQKIKADRRKLRLELFEQCRDLQVAVVVDVLDALGGSR